MDIQPANTRPGGSMKTFAGLSILRIAVLAVAWWCATAATAASSTQQSFATPEAAADALLAALSADGDDALIALFGAEHRNVIASDDRAASTENRARVAAAMRTYRLLEERGVDRRVLLVGEQAWPLPIPLVRVAGQWRFATAEGVDELVNRRIGANERSAIAVLGAYLDAQKDYASKDRDGDGVLQYAQRLASRPGKRDGLYWLADAGKGEDASPFGPLVAESAPYLAGHAAGDPYRGYHFRILTRQGNSAAGGAYNYVINGRMIAGFAMVAYPARYGESGVMTFIVSHNGKLFEKDLGKRTAELGRALAAFDPGAGWKEVTVR